MELNIGEYRILSDNRQFILYRNRKKGVYPGLKPPGEDETTEDIVGYYSDLTSLFRAFPSRMIQRSSTTSLREVMDLLERYRLVIDDALKGA